MVNIAPLAWTLTGLSLDIVGALLVAVEAVKLSNIRALRDRLFVPLHLAVHPVPISWHDGEPSVLKRRDWFGRWVLSPWWSWLVFHALLAAVPFILLDLVLRWVGLYLGARAYHAYADFFVSHGYWIKALVVLGTAYAALATMALVAEPMHQALIRLCALPISILSFIDRRTPDGTVGIIGAGFLVAGFIFQIVGAVASNAHH